MASAVPSPKYFNNEFDDWLERLMKEFHLPGASIAIIDGEEIYAKGYGVSRMDQTKVTEHTLFNTASMTKSFTASAIALLVDDDENYPQVQWDTPVSELMRDDFVLQDPFYTQNITIKDMLTHRTGMADHEPVSLGLSAKKPDTPQSITRALRHLPINKPLRSTWQYNNLMYTAASYMVECVTGKSFGDILKQRFWDPLGMDRVYHGTIRVPEYLEANPSHDGNIAMGHFWDAKKEIYIELPDTNAPEGQGAGIIMSSAADWAKWVQAMMNGTMAVSEKSLNEMTWPQIVCETNEARLQPYQSPGFYGMGLCVEFYRGHKVISHSGGMPGFECWMVFLPKQKWGMVFFGSGQNTFDVDYIVGWTLIDDVLGVSPAERNDWANFRRRRRLAREKENDEYNPLEDLFPDLPNPPLPMALALSAYTGCYKHPAYHDLRVEIKDGYLFADASDRTFGYTLKWQHVSGDYFMAQKATSPESSSYPLWLRSRFELGASGEVGKLGVAFSDDYDEKDDVGYIWFEKLD